MFYKSLILVLMLSITACDGSSSPDKGSNVNGVGSILTPLVSGVSPFSEVQSKRFEVLHSEAAFERLFSLADPFVLPPRLGDIDFSQYVIVAALLGEKKEESWRTEIFRFDEEENYTWYGFPQAGSMQILPAALFPIVLLSYATINPFSLVKKSPTGLVAANS